MNIHELSDLDADALTITTRGTRTWVTCTSEGEEVTVGPVPTQKLTSALPRHTDDMDGGVTAALIEKEAEKPDPSVDYHSMWWKAEREREKAEQERDHWKREADGANADLADLRAAEPRPLSSDAITDEMVERAGIAERTLPTTVSHRELLRGIVRAALSDPRPVHAPVLEDDLAAFADTELPHTDKARADWLTARGWQKSAGAATDGGGER